MTGFYIDRLMTQHDNDALLEQLLILKSYKYSYWHVFFYTRKRLPSFSLDCFLIFFQTQVSNIIIMFPNTFQSSSNNYPDEATARLIENSIFHLQSFVVAVCVQSILPQRQGLLKCVVPTSTYLSTKYDCKLNKLFSML